MDDLQEKVMQGLECCKSRSTCNDECPYYHIMEDPNFGMDDCTSQLAADSLALLKAQEREISRLKNHVDCEAAETTPAGCVGYGRGFNDDEPCETCKQCPAYNGYGEE